MKKFNLSMLAMAGLLFAACADKDIVEGGGGNQKGEIAEEGYMSLNINLPTTPSTRALNDQFDDGDPKEYYVKDCALLIFEDGENDSEKGEANASIIWANNISWDYLIDDTPETPADNITTSYRVVTPISGHTAGRQLYALAVLNYTNVLTVEDNKATITGGTDNKEIKKLGDLYTAIKDVDLTTDKNKNSYFFMTNALLSTVRGGDQDPTIDIKEGDEIKTKAEIIQLAKLDETKIKQTKEEAAKNPAGDILVERAVAKATLGCNVTTVNGVQQETTNSSNDEIELTAKPLAIEKVEWVIDNIEDQTYIARNPGNKEYINYKSGAPDLVSPYRFVSESSTFKNTGLGTAQNFYRTYWCIDPHYSTTLPSTGTTYEDNPMLDCDKFVEQGTNPLYCYENTFNVAHQKYQNTTRAIVKVTLADKTPFYTINNSGVYYTEDDLRKNIIGSIISNPEVGFISIIEDQLAEGSDNPGTIDYTFLDEKVTVKYSTTEDADDNCTISKIELSEKGKTYFGNTNGTGVKFKEGTIEKINEALASIEDSYEGTSFQRYVGGEMYYDVRFQHFADRFTPAKDLAPWNTWEEENNVTAPSSADSYPNTQSNNAEANYLGRYGMVRNNWYEMTVTAFNKLGSPVNPKGDVSTDTTPDDNLSDYISVRIHVLSWAKRTQSWSF